MDTNVVLCAILLLACLILFKMPDEDTFNKDMLKNFEMEQMDRLRLEEKCGRLESMLKQLKKSHHEDLEMMAEKLNLLTRFQQTMDQSLILKQLEQNRIDIADTRKDLHMNFDAFTSAVKQEADTKHEELDIKIADIHGIITSKADILNEKLDDYKSSAVSYTEVSNLLRQSKISFSARLHSSVKDLQLENTLIFSDIETNNGGAYSGATGVFTAPVDGTYTFCVHILGSSRPLEMRLNKNNKGIMWLYANGIGHGADTNMVVVQLQKGDSINVVKNGAFGTRPFYVHHLWSTFSGFLVHAN